MTLTDYNLYVSRIRWHFSDWASKYITAISASGERNRYREYILNLTGLYLDVLESWFVPVKVVGLSSNGSTTITLIQTIDPDDYERYKGHVISGRGITSINTVEFFTSTTIELREPATETNTVVFTIGDNCVDIDELLGLVASLNIIYKTRYRIEGYWTEFDLANYIDEEDDIVVETYPLLYGASANILDQGTLFASLTSDPDFTGQDIDIVYDFEIKYAYFAYPAKYANLANIYDQEGDDVLASGAFSLTTMDVTQPSGVVVSYKVYRTGWKTSIPTETYQFRF